MQDRRGSRYVIYAVYVQRVKWLQNAYCVFISFEKINKRKNTRRPVTPNVIFYNYFTAARRHFRNQKHTNATILYRTCVHRSHIIKLCTYLCTWIRLRCVSFRWDCSVGFSTGQTHRTGYSHFLWTSPPGSSSSIHTTVSRTPSNSRRCRKRVTRFSTNTYKNPFGNVHNARIVIL